MKFYLLLAGLLLSLTAHAQEEYYIINYYTTYNFDFALESKDVLYIPTNQEKSFFQKGALTSREASKPREKREHEIVITTIPKTDQFQYFNFKDNKLISRIAPITKAYLVEEEIPVMHWELVDETKQIKEIELHKAICSFRGRKYTAWYSLEYPIHIGPWKFTGLPGLAFEITDDQSHYTWSLTAIKKETLKALPMRYDLKRGLISLKEYANQVEDELEHMDDSFLARLPKGMEIISSETDNSSLKKFNLELVYE